MTRKNETRADYFATRLAEVWTDTDTANTLGRKLGMTRGAVTGHYNRNRALKLKYPLSGARNPAKPAKKSVRLQVHRANRLSSLENRREGTSQQRKPLRVSDTETGRFTLLGLPACGCRWPFGDTGSFTFCGDAVEGSGPYCEAHAKRSVRRPYDEAA